MATEPLGRCKPATNSASACSELATEPPYMPAHEDMLVMHCHPAHMLVTIAKHFASTSRLLSVKGACTLPALSASMRGPQ